MRVLWLHAAAAIAFTMQVVLAQSAESARSNERSIATAGDFGFSGASAPKRSYRSNRYAFGSGLKPENAEPAQSATDEATGALSTTHMLKGLYEFRDPSWQFQPSIDTDSDMAAAPEKRHGYTLVDWAAYRAAGATLELSQKPPGSPDNDPATGWKTHLGLTPEITTKVGIPSDTPTDIRQRGIMFGANYHF